MKHLKIYEELSPWTTLLFSRDQKISFPISDTVKQEELIRYFKKNYYVTEIIYIDDGCFDITIGGRKDGKIFLGIENDLPSKLRHANNMLLASIFSNIDAKDPNENSKIIWVWFEDGILYKTAPKQLQNLQKY